MRFKAPSGVISIDSAHQEDTSQLCVLTYVNRIAHWSYLRRRFAGFSLASLRQGRLARLQRVLIINVPDNRMSKRPLPRKDLSGRLP